jgi:hypothetical protein
VRPLVTRDVGTGLVGDKPFSEPLEADDPVSELSVRKPLTRVPQSVAEGYLHQRRLLLHNPTGDLLVDMLSEVSEVP